MRALATSLASAVAMFDLEDIVIGGGVASAGETLLNPLRRYYQQLAVYPHLVQVRITTSTMPRTAGLVGAARMAWLSWYDQTVF